MLENFVEAQSYEAEKNNNIVEVYKLGIIDDDGTRIEYRKDVHKVITIRTFRKIYFKIDIKQGLYHCTCNSLMHSALICRHIMKAFIKFNKNSDTYLLYIDDYWKKGTKKRKYHH